MGKRTDETNVVSILDKKEITYNYYSYTSKKLNFMDIANSRGQDLGMTFKTLVTVRKPKDYYVFMVPMEKELVIKKAVKIAGEKSLEMIPQKELLSVTGYIHSGGSPIGMKKQFRTFIEKRNTCTNKVRRWF